MNAISYVIARFTDTESTMNDATRAIAIDFATTVQVCAVQENGEGESIALLNCSDLIVNPDRLDEYEIDSDNLAYENAVDELAEAIGAWVADWFVGKGIDAGRTESADGFLYFWAA